MNTKGVGEVSTAKILARFLEKGEQVLLPFGDNQRYDLVLLRGRKALRVQCKTGFGNAESFSFKTCSQNPFTRVRKNYKHDVEMFAVYYPINGKVYVLPVTSITANDTMTLRLQSSKNSQSKKVNLAQKFEY